MSSILVACLEHGAEAKQNNDIYIIRCSGSTMLSLNNIIHGKENSNGYGLQQVALAKLVHASLHVGGYNVIITGRRKEKLDTLRRELENMGAEVLAMEFDVRERASARKAVDFLKGKWANINVLINNAGLALGLDKEYEGSFEDWDTMIDTNIKGLLNMTRFVVPGMVERNEGHIINIGSVAGDAAYANGNVYCATKAAVKALSDGLRIDVAESNVRVTNLKPGLVQTNFSNVRFHGDDARAEKCFIKV